jgi:predicted ATP-grasp superfamily ATP-dependent carboligase
MPNKEFTDEKPGVIVIGGHVQGLGITRIFGKNNISVILLDDNSINLTKHSKYCNKFIKYSKNGLLRILEYLIEQNKYKNWLLMPTNDKHLEILGDNKNKLSKHFKVSTANIEVLKYFFNKRLTYKLASDLNIEIPKTWTADNWEEIVELDITYPCIIKPAVMYTFYSQIKKKVFVCNDEKELKENYNRALSLIPKDEVIIQDIIPGNSEHQYSVCFMFDGVKPLVTLSARRARQHPPDFGNATTYAETVNIPEIVTSAEKILKEINFIGICEVEFKFDIRDNKYKFLEVNPRTWKWHSIAEKSNSPILMSLYHHTYNLVPIIKNEQKNATFRHLMTDIPTIVKMKLSKINYNKTKKNTKYAVWDIKDLLPAFFEILYLPYFILKR